MPVGLTDFVTDTSGAVVVLVTDAVLFVDTGSLGDVTVALLMIDAGRLVEATVAVTVYVSLLPAAGKFTLENVIGPPAVIVGHVTPEPAHVKLHELMPVGFVSLKLTEGAGPGPTLVMTTVYVIVWPGPTADVGDTDFVTDRSGWVIVFVTDAVLLAVAGSLENVAVAVFVTDAGGEDVPTVATMVNVSFGVVDTFAGKVTVAESAPLVHAAGHVAPPTAAHDTELYVNPVGTGSLMTTPDAAPGPLFETPTVYVMVWPGPTAVDGEAVLVTAMSGCVTAFVTVAVLFVVVGSDAYVAVAVLAMLAGSPVVPTTAVTV
jgi:hypothetical protein